MESTRFLRFVLVGAVCFCCGLLLMWLLTEQLAWHYIASATVSMAAVNLLGWLLNRQWTFALSRPRSWQEFLRYLSVNLLGMGVTLVLLAWLVSGLQVHYVLACGAVGVIMAAANFTIHGRWSLKANAPSRHEADKAQ